MVLVLSFHLFITSGELTQVLRLVHTGLGHLTIYIIESKLVCLLFYKIAE